MAIKMISPCTWSGNLLALQTCYARSHLLPVPLHNPLPEEGQINLMHQEGLTEQGRERMLLSTGAQLALQRAHRAKVRSPTELRAWILITLFFKSQGKTCDSCPLLMDTLHWNMVLCLPASLHHAAILWMERKGSPLYTNEADLKQFKRKSQL